jgi:hypothetical protein
MIGMKRTLLLSCSLLLACTAFGSSNVDSQGRELKAGKKAAKKGKKAKVGKKPGSAPAPTRAGGPREPTTLSPAAYTPSPTSANSIPIRASLYTISYDTTEDRLPSEEEYTELAELTRVYLEEFMFAEFAITSLTTLDDFLTAMISKSFTAGDPVLVGYRSIGLFTPSSIFLPTVRELDDGLITPAFTTDNLAYLALVQALPSQNIFSSTSTAIIIRV